MTFLPAVMRTRIASTSEIIIADATKELFSNLRRQHDYIVIDLPPLLPVVDARATTHFVDGYVFVIEWGRTKIDEVTHALGRAPGIYKNLLGIVLNKADTNVLWRYEADGGYNYGDRYIRYGITE